MHSGVEHREHIRMIQRRECLGLLLEAPQSIRIAREVLRQHLDGHLAIQAGVPRAKDLAHPARADAGGDSVLVERGADHFFSRNSASQFWMSSTEASEAGDRFSAS